MTPSTAWAEQIAPNEAEHFERLAERLRDLQLAAARGKAPARALHAKGNLGLLAELEVLPDLPEHARVGLFAQPARYRGYARFSNGAMAHQSDRKPDVRGLAVKLLGVPGKKVIPGLEDATTQDFLFIRTPTIPFRDPDEFVELVAALRAPLLGFPRFIGRFGLGRTFKVLGQAQKGLSAPTVSLATTRYYSAAPFRFGAYAVRHSLAPRTPADPAARPGSTPDYLAEELIPRLQRGPVQWDFQVQFFADPARTPIEDPSVDWPEELSPHLTVGRLTLPQQDPRSDAGQALAREVESLSFDPWHAQEELRPLGAIMRARNHAYRLSTQARGAAPEPTGSEPRATG